MHQLDHAQSTWRANLWDIFFTPYPVNFQFFATAAENLLGSNQDWDVKIVIFTCKNNNKCK